jgi:hypothetical protein
MTGTTVPQQSIGTGALRPHRTLLVASLGFFLITLEILILSVALARIGREFGGGTSGQERVVDGYTLMFASLLLFAGMFLPKTTASAMNESG